MSDTWLAIINPAAGKGRALHVWEALRTELDQLHIPYTSFTSGYAGHVSEIARSAAKEGSTHFISVGGDGTHHELINGLLSSSTPDRLPIIAIANAGTGNDWSRTHRITNNVKQTALSLKTLQTVRHAAGKVSFTKDGCTVTRYFVNVAGMALDGRVVEKFPVAMRKIPFLPGYLIAGLKQLFVYRAPRLNIEGPDLSFDGYFITVHAGIGKYSGGGMQFVPHADFASDRLAITCIQHMSIARLLANIYRLYTGTILAHPKVKGFSSPWLKVSSPSGETVPIEADGEFLGYTPVEIEIIPSAFRLVVN